MDLFAVCLMVLGASSAAVIFLVYRTMSMMRKQKRQIRRQNLEDQMRIKARNISNSDV